MRKFTLLLPLILFSGSLIYLDISASALGHPVINEFELNPPGNDRHLIVEEWVEIYNPTLERIDIGGWTLSTTHGKTVNLTIPEGTMIDAGGYYVFSRMSMWLDNVDESIILRNALGVEVDQTPVKSDDDNDNSSWSRNPNGRDTDTDVDWNFQNSTSGEPNREVSIPTICAGLPLIENVTVHFIDVGQGDSIFVDTPDLDMLIDGGKKGAGDTVVAYLQDLGITRIDIVVATHPDEDHIGGLLKVFTAYNASQAPMVIDSNYTHSTKTYKIYQANRTNRDHLVANRSYSFLLDECVNVTVLNPTISHEFGDSHEFRDTNENSVVLRMVVGEVVFLFEGDAEEGAEESMLGSGLEMSASILKVGHHGSNSSTTQPFLNAVNPDVAIISVGEGYEHPTDWTLQKLGDIRATIFQTDEYGDVVITTDGTGYEVSVERTGFDVTADNDIVLTRMIAISIIAGEVLIVWRNSLRH